MTHPHLLPKHSMRELKRTLDAGKKPCELCNRAADSPHSPEYCRPCSRTLARTVQRERRKAR